MPTATSGCALRRPLCGFSATARRRRLGRCNDGSATPGCAGDQGTTYYYGNNFNPAGQTPFAADSWFCLEIHAKANTVGQSDGELGLWKDDALVGEYKPGTPRGRWLRDNFYSWGQYFVDEQAAGPYVLWRHRHSFSPREQGTLVEDRVEYILPFSWLGRLVHRMIVRRQLAGIFEHRQRALAELWREAREPAAQ